MAEEEEHVLGCIRVADGPRYLAPNSRQTPCRDCKEMVWVSEPGRGADGRYRMVEDGHLVATDTVPDNPTVVCLQCAMRRARLRKDFDAFQAIYSMLKAVTG